MQVADRAIVLRRGKKIGEATPSRENHDRIVSMIIGAEGVVATG
jgi:ABC-type sugar transport system ATPase subunit